MQVITPPKIYPVIVSADPIRIEQIEKVAGHRNLNVQKDSNALNPKMLLEDRMKNRAVWPGSAETGSTQSRARQL